MDSINNEITDQKSFSPLTVSEVDVDILPIVYDIIRSVERDVLDNSAKARESQDCSQKILELQKKLDSARAQIRRLPGIEYNKQEQLRQFEILRNQLHLKRELLQKYLANNEQLVQKIAESYPVKRAAQLCVSLYYRSQNVARENLPPVSNIDIKSFLSRFKKNISEGITDAKQQLKNEKKSK